MELYNIFALINLKLFMYLFYRSNEQPDLLAKRSSGCSCESFETLSDREFVR